MAKKQAGAKKVEATKTPTRRLGKAVRLDLSEKDHEMLEQVATAKGLNMASYTRMVLLAQLKKDKEEMGR